MQIALCDVIAVDKELHAGCDSIGSKLDMTSV
uniref:Diguanylate cyclase n=1 Tax=Heterorhabditis bacteriophora TaxID=37862 RepID=A0A1I7WTK9_HETBA